MGILKNGANYERYTEDSGLSKRGEENTGRKQADGTAVTRGAIGPMWGLIKDGG
jgi:hypothetical protein